jgi:hypothetical protein
MATIYEIVRCGKCSGTGYIGSYAAIKNGICFPCEGKGELKVKVGSSTWYIVLLERYEQRGFCPNFSEISVLGSVCMMENDTAVVKVAKDSEYYYFGQPICGGSGWHKVPVSEIKDFIPAYKKHILKRWKYKTHDFTALDKIAK